MAVLQGGGQNLPSPCVCYPKDPMWNRVNKVSGFCRVLEIGKLWERQARKKNYLQVVCASLCAYFGGLIATFNESQTTNISWFGLGLSPSVQKFSLGLFKSVSSLHNGYIAL